MGQSNLSSYGSNSHTCLNLAHMCTMKSLNLKRYLFTTVDFLFFTLPLRSSLVVVKLGKIKRTQAVLCVLFFHIL